MSSTMKGIGFSGIKNKQSWDDLVADVLNEPSRTFMRKYEDDKVVMEYYKEYSEKVYLLVRVALGEGNKEEKKPKVYIEECEPYVEATYTLEIQDLDIEDTEDEFIFYVVCEDVGTGMQIVFWLQNVIEYLDCMEDEAIDYTGARIVGIGSEGTIVLPIEKGDDDAEYENTEREYLRAMLQRAKAGDEEAIEMLENEEEQLDEQLKERLRREDFLTVMDGYFLPATNVEATYAILGTIKELEIRENSKTKEKMYWMYIDVNGMFVEVIINMEDLVGKPSIGMRFMGTCWMQGTVEFE
ncbi:MAG TPA: DUF3881 family protein [Epulopiscium sp.]|nr:DUF3881 family protein [Candidatus Epulonipiscium sp.]